MTESSKETPSFQFDQLPPFNFTLLFNDETGYASYQRLLGVRLVSDGVIYSTQDMYSEQTITYMAADLTPLLPLTLSSLYQLPGQVKAASAERTPADAERLRYVRCCIPNLRNLRLHTRGYLRAKDIKPSRARRFCAALSSTATTHRVVSGPWLRHPRLCRPDLQPAGPSSAKQGYTGLPGSR